MPDVFVSYSRRDTDFVRRVTASLEEHGKTPWLDTQGIADGEVFPQALRTAIEESDAFLFVITPASVASTYCEQEVDYALSLQKRIVPVLRQAVPDPEVPEEIRHRNWIPFTEADDYDASLDRVLRALDTDLEARKEHTRWLTKAVEWDAKGREKSLLLRGSELKAAGSWLDRTGPDADPAPTALQRQYVEAGRRAAARRQRTGLVAAVVVAVIAVGLGVVALISRSQAVATSTTAKAQALAARSENELDADPEVSVLLAREAVETSPIPQAVAALRQAMDASTVRLALPTVNVNTCANSASSLITYSPDGKEVVAGSCDGDLSVFDATTGRLLARHHLGAPAVDTVAYDPVGHQLAFGTAKGVDLLNPATLAVESTLASTAGAYGLAFSPDGSELAAVTSDGVTVWDLSTGTARSLVHDTSGDYGSLAFTSDSQDLVVGTDLGYTAVYDVASGQLVHQLSVPGQDATGDAGVVAVAKDLLVVGNGVSIDANVVTNVGADVDLWNTTSWTMTKVLTPVAGSAVGAVAVSPDATTVAVGNADGAGSIWSVATGTELEALAGQTADINTMVFSPDGRSVAAVANDGTTRVYRASGPWSSFLAFSPCACGREFELDQHQLVGLNRTGDDLDVQKYSLPSGRPESPPVVLATDQAALGALLSPNGKLAATFIDNSTSQAVTLYDTSTGRTLRVLPPVNLLGTAFSTDGRLFAENVAPLTGYSPDRLRVVDVATGHAVTGGGWPDSGELATPAISDDDRLVAVSAFTGLVSIGRTDDAKPFESFNQHAQVADIAFNPTGTRLAVASWDGSVTVLDVATDRPVLQLVGDTNGVTFVRYSPNGRYIVTSSEDSTVRVWDATSGQLLEIYTDDLYNSEIEVAGDSTLVGDVDSSGLRVWPLCADCQDPSALLASSRGSVVSPLTPLERTAAASGG